MVKVYLMDVADLPDPAEHPEVLEYLTKERKEKTLRYKQIKDRKQSLGAGLMLKKCLEEYNISVEEIKYSENGKPEVDGIYFNLSHSDNIVVCSIDTKSVGCDVEKIGKARERIAEHFFTDNEVRYLNQFSNEEKVDEFYRLWTIKESYMKMTGEGSALALNAFEITIEDEIKIRRDGKLCDCHIKEYHLPGFKLTVCGEDNEFSAKIERRDMHEKI